MAASPSSQTSPEFVAPERGATDAVGAKASKYAAPLAVPATVDKRHILWDYTISLIVFHLLSLLAFVPWFFSWTGVVLALGGCYVFGTLGINLCYHRLLTHSGFECPKWLEHFFATLGVLCLQDSPARWVGIHRLHHQHSDEQPDPHSPMVRFFWGHVGWLLVDNQQLHPTMMYDRYCRDILKDPFYFKLERNLRWFWWNIVALVGFFVAGYAIGWLVWGQAAALQYGASVALWGAIVRTVLVWHITWSINSVTHMFGYRNYETDENSQNNWLIALLSNGEGWHNNHHADQRSAAHGHRWWELDVTYLTILALERVGLAWNVVRPRVKLVDRTP